MRSISVLVMLFSLLMVCLLPERALSELIDRVMASVDDEAITSFDLEGFIAKMKARGIRVTGKEALDTLVNRKLLIGEARKLRLEAESDDRLIERYIEIKIRPFVFVKQEEVRAYFEEHKENFKGVDYLQVRPKIERLIFEKKLNGAIKRHLRMLKKRHSVKIIHYPEN